MQVLSEPLYKTEIENRRELAGCEKAAFKRIVDLGDFEGNRHQRRLAAKMARKSAQGTGASPGFASAATRT